MVNFKRVEGYAFRGDTRDPLKIKADGGFNPPATRTDDYYLDNNIIPNFCDYMKKRFGQDNIDQTALRNFIKANHGTGTTFIRYETWRAMLEQESMHLGRMVADEFLKGYISTSRSTRVAKRTPKAGAGSTSCTSKAPSCWANRTPTTG